MTMWMVRAGRGGEVLDEFIQRSVVGFSFDGGRQLSADANEKLVTAAVTEANPTAKEGAVKGWVAQTLRFLKDVQVGDLAVTYDREARLYFIGEVKTAPMHLGDVPGIAHARKVQWTKKVPRDVLQVDTRNTLGAIQTFFLINDVAAADVLAHAVAYDLPAKEVPNEPAPHSTTAAEALREQVVEQSQQLIEDRINRLSWEDMQFLVAGVLRAMGYKTHVSPPGPDRGYDIFASPDGLGLQEPRVFVEVKHREGRMSSKEVRSFLGGRGGNDKCLYISTGGFTKDARYEADRAQVPIRLIDLAQLRQLVLDHYEKLDVETTALVPLARVYWPTGD